jgi:hypothetical protein
MILLHPELRRFEHKEFLRDKGASRLSGYQILKRVALGGEVVYSTGDKVFVDVGRIWCARESEKYVKRFTKLLKMLDAKLLFAEGEGTWLMMVDRERAAMAQLLYKSWVFNHEFCLHKRSRKMNAECVKGKLGQPW